MALEHPRPQPAVEPNMQARQPRIHGSVAKRRGAGQPPPLTLARGRDTRANRIRALPLTAIGDELQGASRLELAHEVDPVEQRTAQAPLVAGAGVTLAFAVAPGARAGTRI